MKIKGQTKCQRPGIKAMWKEQGKREVSMKSLELYVKPEESKVYYVINSQDKKPVIGEIDY